jgi:hypothetical protein
MWHVYGYSGSHWTPALGNCLYRIAPVSAKATINKQQSTNTPSKLAILMAIAMQWYDTARIVQSMEEVQGFTRCHWMPPLGKHLLRYPSIGHANTGFSDVFHRQIVKKGHKHKKHKDSPK